MEILDESNESAKSCCNASLESNSTQPQKFTESSEEILSKYTDADPSTNQAWNGKDFLRFTEEVADNA